MAEDRPPQNTIDAVMDHAAKGHDPLGQRRPLRVDAAGYLLPPPPLPTFRAQIGVAGPAGVAAELIPGAGVRLHVRSVFITKPTVATAVTLIKQSTATTGGTSTNATIGPLDSAKAASGSRIKLFTGAPTAGTSVGSLAIHTLETTDWMLFTFGENGAGPLVLNTPNQTLAVSLGTAATIVGYIEWSEEVLT